jgi:hypothetical protein
LPTLLWIFVEKQQAMPFNYSLSSLSQSLFIKTGKLAAS